nr:MULTISPECIES: hypothetical protein [spotted fever group]
MQELEQAQKAPIEYIAFSGGGAKGAQYIPELMRQQKKLVF